MFLKNNLLFLKKSNSFQTLSELTKIPKTTLCDITTGLNQNPKLDVLIKISQTFNITIDDLVFKDLSSGK